jgi:hypothetical protein
MATDVSVWDGTQWVSIVGPEGPAGVDGKDGSGVTIIGTLSGTNTPLPVGANAGEMWIVGDPVPTAIPASSTGPAQVGDGVVFNGTSFTNVGPIRGPQGSAGNDGAEGQPGVDGAKGDKGDKGDAGADGADGVDGAPGVDGVDGAPGVDGVDGAPGVDGTKGDKGDPGTDGAYVAAFVQPSAPIHDTNAVINFWVKP